MTGMMGWRFSVREAEAKPNVREDGEGREGVTA